MKLLKYICAFLLTVYSNAHTLAEINQRIKETEAKLTAIQKLKLLNKNGIKQDLQIGQSVQNITYSSEVKADSENTSEAESNSELQNLNLVSHVITRSVIEQPFESGIVFVGATCKPFKSSQNTIVTHLTLTASRDQINVYDGDGNNLYDYQTDEQLETPLQIIKSSYQSDMTFYLLYESHVSQYRLRFSETGQKSHELSVVKEWSFRLGELNVTGYVKQAITARVNRRTKLCLLDESDGLIFIGKDGKVEDKIYLEFEQIKQVKMHPYYFVIQSSSQLVFRKIGKDNITNSCQLAVEIHDFALMQSNPNVVFVLSENLLTVLQVSPNQQPFCKTLGTLQLNQNGTQVMTISQLLVILTSDSTQIQLIKLTSDPQDIFNQIKAVYDTSCEYQTGKTTDEHLLLQCNGSLLTIQSTIQTPIPEQTWIDKLYSYMPTIMLILSVLITIWWQWSTRKKKNLDQTQLKNKRQEEIFNQKQFDNKSRKTDDRPYNRKQFEQVGSDEYSDDADRAKQKELIHQNRVSAGFESTKKQQAELEKLQKQIGELEGKFGKDISGMMNALKGLQDQTSALGKFTESIPKQDSQLVSDHDDSD